MDHLTASVGAVVGTSALLYFITAPRRQRDDDVLRLTPWEEQSTIARTRHIRDKFQQRKRRQVGGGRSMDSCSYSTSFRRKTSSMSEEEFGGGGCGGTSDGSVTSDRS